MKDEKKTKKQLIEELKELRAKLDAASSPSITSIEEKSAFLDKIINSTSEGIFVLDENVNYKLINPACGRMVGHNPADWVGKRAGSFVLEEDRERVSECFYRAWGGEPSGTEVRVLGSDGRPRFLELHLSPLLWEGRSHVLGVVNDITSRKNAEEVERNAEVRSRTIIEAARDCVFIKDADGAYSHVNPAMELLFGVPANELIGKKDDVLFGERAAINISETDRKVFAGEVVEEEITKQTGGKTITFHVVKVPLQDEKGDITGICGFARDITKLKLAEEEVRRLGQFYESIIDNANIWLNVLDEDANVIIWNKAAEQISGYSRREVVGHGKIWEWLYPEKEYREKITKMAASIIKDGVTVENFETVIRAKDGSYRTIHWHSRNLVDENGNPIGSLALGRDVTELKEMSRALAESEKKYRLLAENLSDIIITMDMDLNVTYVSPSLETVSGYRPNEITARGLKGVLSPGSLKLCRKALGEALERARKEPSRRPDALVLELEGRKKDGSALWVEVKSNFLRDGDGEPRGILGLARDITEGKQAREALKELTESFMGLYEGAFEGIAVHHHGRILDANNTLARMLGYTREELLGKTVPNLIDPASKAVVKKDIEQGIDKIYETTCLKKDGSRLFVEMSSKPYVHKGRKVRLMAIRDVTERKKTTEALKESEQLYRSLVETSPDCVFLCDLNAGVLMVNHRAVELFLMDRMEEFIGSNVLDFVAEEDRGRVRELLERTIEEKSLRNMDFRFLRKDGTVFHGDMSTSLITDAGGNPKAILGITRDVSERKAAENALAAEKERLSVTLRSIADGVISTDTEGRVILINKAAERLTGWRQDEAVGRDIETVFRTMDEKTLDRCENPVKLALEKRAIFNESEHTVLVARDGAERLISQSAAPVQDADSALIGAVLVFRDITERRKMEEERLRAQKLESVGILAGGIAHDFNNILTAVLGNVTLARAYSRSEDMVDRKLMEAEKAIFRARDLTRQFLTFSKGGAPVKESASIKDLVMDCVDFALSGSNVSCRFDIQQDLWPVVVDAAQIGQVVNNLVINAKQAMPEGGNLYVRAENIHLGGNVSMPLNKGRYIKLTVADTGTGIPEKHIAKVFDPYFTTKQEGSGLGLAISYYVIKKHDGFIDFESVPGKGTTFYVYLPAGEDVSGGSETKTKTDLPEYGGKRGRILFMDDEETVRRICGELLQHMGYSVDFAADGAEALEKYGEAMDSRAPFDVVIADLTVPGGMGGKELVIRLKEMDPGAKVVVSSGYSNDPIMADYGEHGFCGVVAKPYKIGELGEIIDRIMAGSGGVC